MNPQMPHPKFLARPVAHVRLAERVAAMDALVKVFLGIGR
jgi:hypothetical protein